MGQYSRWTARWWCSGCWWWPAGWRCSRQSELSELLGALVSPSLQSPSHLLPPRCGTQEVTFLSLITGFRGETFRPKYEDGSFDLTWVTVRLKCVLDEQVGLT